MFATHSAPQTTRLALTLGEAWTQHSHTAPWARWSAEKPHCAQHSPSGVFSPWPQSDTLPAITHLHPEPMLLLGPAWGTVSPSGPQNLWSWDSAAPTSYCPPWGLPCALLELQPLPVAISSHQTTAWRAGHRCPVGSLQAEVGAHLLLHVPAGGFWPGHVQCQAKPHLPGPWTLPGVPMALQHHRWSGRAGVGQSQELRGPRALLLRGAAHRHHWCHPHGPRHSPQPWGGVRGLLRNTLHVFCSPSSIASVSRTWGAGWAREGVMAWPAGHSAGRVQAGYGQGAGRMWGSGKVQVRCRCSVGRVERGAGNV